MLFKVFPQDEWIRLYEILAADRVVGPVQKGVDRHGHSLYDFDVVPESCNHLAFASQYGQICCVGFAIFMLSVAQLRLR